MRRTGIDLSPTRCNVIDAESPGRRRKGESCAFRVHEIASIAHGGDPQALTAGLKALVERSEISRRAWVNLWDVRSSHQHLLLPSDRESELESMARHRGASVLGMSVGDVTVASIIGATRGEPGHHPKTEVSFFAAGSQDIRDRIRPLADAGFQVEGVTTPCGALWSQARLRASLPGDVHAYVALGEQQYAFGIFTDGTLLFARDLDWGYAQSASDRPAPQDAEMLAERLSSELRRSFLYVKQSWEQEISQVLLCGDMPAIRSLTRPLMDRLSIEVETLDTLDGIDAQSVPEGFSERAAAFRLASAIAAEPPPVNLLPVAVAPKRRSEPGLHIAAAGTAAVVAFGAFLYAHAGVRRVEAERELASVQRALSSLPRDVTQANITGTEAETEAARRAALAAMDAQGPAMARILEALGRIAPQAATLKSVSVTAEREAWRITIAAFAANRDARVARQDADRFLHALSQAAALGAPIEGTTQRIVSGSSGVDLQASYRVSR